MSSRVFILAIMATILVQISIVGVMLKDRFSTLRSGQTVLIKSRFVDPRDIFRGHYVRLNLQSDPTVLKIADDFEYVSGGDVLVELEEAEDGFWVPRALHDAPPESGEPVLRARLFRQKRLKTNDEEGELWRVSVRYPFNRYFAPKERALELENLRREQRLGVIIALDGRGGGVIAGVTIDGQKIYDEPLF